MPRCLRQDGDFQRSQKYEAKYIMLYRIISRQSSTVSNIILLKNIVANISWNFEPICEEIFVWGFVLCTRKFVIWTADESKAKAKRNLKRDDSDTKRNLGQSIPVSEQIRNNRNVFQETLYVNE